MCKVINDFINAILTSGDWSKVEQIFKDIFEKEEDIELQIWKL